MSINLGTVNGNVDRGIVKTRISLPVLDNKTQESIPNLYKLEAEIDQLTMNNEHSKAIPKVLEWLFKKNAVTQSDCIRAAGICLLGGKHDIYLALLDIAPRSHQQKSFNDAEKEKLNKLDPAFSF